MSGVMGSGGGSGGGSGMGHSGVGAGVIDRLQSPGGARFRPPAPTFCRGPGGCIWAGPVVGGASPRFAAAGNAASTAGGPGR